MFDPRGSVSLFFQAFIPFFLKKQTFESKTNKPLVAVPSIRLIVTPACSKPCSDKFGKTGQKS